MKKKESSNGGKRSTPAEIEQRITAILPYVMMGKTVPEIFHIVSVDASLQWGITERQLYNYVSDTREYIEKYSAINRNLEIGKVRYRLEELFKMAIKEKDINQARLILRDYTELFSLRVPPKMESDTTLKIIFEDA